MVSSVQTDINELKQRIRDTVLSITTDVLIWASQEVKWWQMVLTPNFNNNPGKLLSHVSFMFIALTAIKTAKL
jgi:hypothetical protein